MDIFKNSLVLGLGTVFAATVLAPVLLPVMSSVGRPLAKSLIKGGMMLYEKGREAVAVAGESVEDMMAEIRAEDAARAASPSDAGHVEQNAYPATPAQAGDEAPAQAAPGTAPA